MPVGERRCGGRSPSLSGDLVAGVAFHAEHGDLAQDVVIQCLSRRRYSSATIAANSGVGSEPTALAKISSSSSGPGSARSAAGRTEPPPRFSRSCRRVWAITLRVVITTRSRQRSSRSPSWGNRPRARPAHRLSKRAQGRVFLVATGVPAARRTQSRSCQFDHSREVPFPEAVRGSEVALFEVGNPTCDRTLTIIWHVSALLGYFG